jgi:hypothetical protein
MTVAPADFYPHFSLIPVLHVHSLVTNTLVFQALFQVLEIPQGMGQTSSQPSWNIHHRGK